MKGVGGSKSHLGYRILILVPEMGNWGQDDYLGEKLMLLTAVLFGVGRFLCLDLGKHQTHIWNYQTTEEKGGLIPLHFLPWRTLNQ